MDAAELLDRLICLLYPPRCVLCGQVTEYDSLWCGRCPLAGGAFSPQSPGSLEGIAAPLEYSGNVRRAIWALKEEGDKRAAEFFAQRMADLAEGRWQGGFDLVVPVPASPARLRERGFNQAWLLVENLGRRLEIPAEPDLLCRRDDTRVQRSLNRRERWENARRSYSLSSGAAVAGKGILLVDDVYTTGATSQVCGELLLEAGAARVWGLMAAYTNLEKPEEGEENAL